jgi:hypothetical protein
MAKDRTKNVAGSAEVDRDAIEKLAYQYWMNRGCPDGSAEQDWLEAERILLAAGSPGGKNTSKSPGKVMKAVG